MFTAGFCAFHKHSLSVEPTLQALAASFSVVCKLCKVHESGQVLHFTKSRKLSAEFWGKSNVKQLNDKTKYCMLGLF